VCLCLAHSSGSLHSLFPLAEIFFPQIGTWPCSIFLQVSTQTSSPTHSLYSPFYRS
jgi:hypothetical protein